MAIYAGETIRIKVKALDPETGSPLDPAPNSAEVSFWHQDTGDPSKNPAVRDTPDHGPYSMVYDAELDAFVLYQTTDGATPWQAGKWYYQAKVTGASYETWEYANFKIKE